MTTKAQMREQFGFLNIRNIRYEPMGALILADTDKGTMRLADLRGWGHLTGGGSWNLDQETARKVQDAIGHVLAESFAAHQSAAEQTDRYIERYLAECDSHMETKAALIAIQNQQAEQMKPLVEAAKALMVQYDAYKAGVQSSDEAYYKLAKYAYNHWQQLAQALATIEQQEKKNG